MFVFYSNRLGCVGSIVLSVIVSAILIMAMRSCSTGPDMFGGLKAAHAGHQHVEQDDGELVGLQLLEGFLARTRLHEVLAEVFEDHP
jgi:hypothetical protein